MEATYETLVWVGYIEHNEITIIAIKEKKYLTISLRKHAERSIREKAIEEHKCTNA